MDHEQDTIAKILVAGSLLLAVVAVIFALTGCGGAPFTTAERAGAAESDAGEGGASEGGGEQSDAPAESSEAGTANADAGRTCQGTVCCYAPEVAGCAYTIVSGSGPSALYNWVPACCSEGAPSSVCGAPWPGGNRVASTGFCE
jgi:hypothetical protein